MTRTRLLNLAAWLPVTRVLGPGRRFAFWVQGCPLSCPGCLAPAWQQRRRAFVHSVAEVADWILSVPNLEGITLSGGEPMLQARALCALIDTLQIRRKLTVICFTGLTWNQIQAARAASRRDLLNRVDVLIHGPYQKEKNDNKGLRGSSNQEISFLTPAYTHLKDDFEQSERKVEIHVQETGILTAGIHPVGLASDLDAILNK